MKLKRCRFVRLVIVTVLTAIPITAALANDQNPLAQLLKAPYRTQANVVRDVHRHPIETVTFFGVKDNSTVVEILPGTRRYYPAILTPYLKTHGVYIAANREVKGTALNTRPSARATASPVGMSSTDLRATAAKERGITLAGPPKRGRFICVRQHVILASIVNCEEF